jgi:hypothetical protein
LFSPIDVDVEFRTTTATMDRAGKAVVLVVSSFSEFTLWVDVEMR